MVLLIGDSFGAQGETVTVASGDSWDKNGTPQTVPGNVTLSSIAGGFYTRIKELRPGITVDVYQHAVSTIDLETIFLSYWPLVRGRALTAGKTPTVLLICAGTNSSAVGESAVVPGYLSAMYRAWQTRFPGLRIVHLGPVVDETDPDPGEPPDAGQARPEAQIVRDAIAAACDGITRHYIDARDYTAHADGVHLASASYTEVGRDAADLYFNGG